MKAKIKIGALLLAGTLAISAVGVGFAAWQTTITADGNVTASGKWDVTLNDASIQLSTGAAATTEVTVYDLTRTNMKEDRYIYGDFSWYKSGGAPATPSDQPMSKYLDYYLVDTAKFGDLVSDEAIASITAEQRDAIIADETTYSVREAVPYQYWPSTAARIVDALLTDCTAAVKEQFPNTYQNYALVRLASVTTKSHTVGRMNASTLTVTPAPNDRVVLSADKTSASFANVGFSLPGAWANYTLTITNNGTADAYLRDAVISLEGDCDQLVLDKPDFTDEVLKAGESCTFNVVVKVADIEENELSANAVLTITLPYGQVTVEPAPQPGHSHN